MSSQSSSSAERKEIAAAVGAAMSAPSVSIRPAPVQRQARDGESQPEVAGAVTGQTVASEESASHPMPSPMDAGPATREAAGSSSMDTPASLSAAAGYDGTSSAIAMAMQDDPCALAGRLVTPDGRSAETARLIGLRNRVVKVDQKQVSSESSPRPDGSSPLADELDRSIRAAVGAIAIQRHSKTDSLAGAGEQKPDARGTIREFIRMGEAGFSFD